MPLHRTIYNDQYAVIGTSGPADGVAVMIRQDVQYSIRAKTTRVIKVEIDDLVTIIGTYGPTEQSADRIKAQYWDHLTGLITEGKPLLIAGDLNAGHEYTEARTIKGVPNYTRLQRLVHQHNLTIIKTPPTWLSKRSKDQKPSRTLDRIITSTIPDDDQASIAQLDWENAPADHAILTYKWTVRSLRHDQGRPKNVAYTRDPGEPTTKAWGELRTKLKQHFKQLQKPAAKQNAYTRLWEQYRKQMGEEGLTLIDQEGNDLEPAKARSQLKQMLYERWGMTDTNHIPMKRESKVYLDQPPCIDEITKAVKAINRKAATGLDGIPARHTGDIPIEDLQQLFEQIWTYTKIPRQLVDMKVKMIPKAKPRTTIDNTRPITIPSTISKVLNQVILTHISPCIEPHLLPQQHAYRKGRGTATAVAELFTKFNKPGQTLLLLDLSKAFDTVNHTALFAALRATDIPSKEYNLIRDQYIDAEVRIQWAKRYAPAFPLTNGIRQGCLLSTTLFNLVEAEREKKCRAKMKTIPYDVIMYADDKAVILDEPQHVQRLMEVNKETAAEYGMLQNNAKTARLRLDKDTKEIQTVKWMGILLDNKMSMNQEVMHRIGKAKKAAVDYAETIKNIPPSLMNTKIKVSAACTIILPHLVYLWREIPFTAQQRETITDTATQLLARVFSNTSGVTATSILRHVNEITKGLTPRMKQIGNLGDILPTASIDGVPAGTTEQPEQTNGTDIKYARLDQQIETLPDKGTAALRVKVPRLLLPTTEAENFFSPREEPHYEETRDVFTTTLETSPPTPGFGKDKYHPQLDNMTLRLSTVQEVERAQLTCPYCGATKTTKQAARAHYTTAHPGLYRPPADDPCYCIACKRVMTKPYYRDHRCRKPPRDEFAEQNCQGCGIRLANPQLSAHLIHCVKYQGRLTPLKQNSGAFDFAKKIRDLIKPSPSRLIQKQEQLSRTTASPNDILTQARSSLRPHTPRGGQRTPEAALSIPTQPRQKPEMRNHDRQDEAERMRRDTEERIRREQSTCSQCNKELRSSQALRRHDALYHPGTERPKGLPIYCTGCDTPFKTAATFVKHRCSGTPEEELAPRQCHVCQQVTLSNPEYSAHLLRHQIIEGDKTDTTNELYNPQGHTKG
ncbi:endonuclease-reverse transcriptase [Gregarina niphandrodes]|uniref:Endonuclease-reverse transcriptase n=1 Tax=Gregarina niphandrodes TaxID=110365 RepID=A0A023AWI9_GRENI|nr:endonuclease-reverse transcriptase [Gregarina niphandrodes]EZG43079.1 endonuclease-reverse transcriptase [Gregarina niphandrodes]|eukprot:XP_011133648.1 endonuclease-reverse transcriptase [Gregarina niphandrodes]